MLRIFPAITPIPNESSNSNNKIIIKNIPISSLFINALAMEKQMANNIITNTSISTVTPSTVLVKGPFARISFITAMADDGDLATKIVPNNMEIDF